MSSPLLRTVAAPKPGAPDAQLADSACKRLLRLTHARAPAIQAKAITSMLAMIGSHTESGQPAIARLLSGSSSLLATSPVLQAIAWANALSGGDAPYADGLPLRVSEPVEAFFAAIFASLQWR